MKIEDRRSYLKEKCAGIGDIIVTDRNTKYLLLDNSHIDKKYPIAICDLSNNCVSFTTCESILCIGGDIMDETIIEIIPRNRLKLVIE